MGEAVGWSQVRGWWRRVWPGDHNKYGEGYVNAPSERCIDDSFE